MKTPTRISGTLQFLLDSSFTKKSRRASTSQAFAGESSVISEIFTTNADLLSEVLTGVYGLCSGVGETLVLNILVMLCILFLRPPVPHSNFWILPHSSPKRKNSKFGFRFWGEGNSPKSWALNSKVDFEDVTTPRNSRKISITPGSKSQTRPRRAKCVQYFSWLKIVTYLANGRRIRNNSSRKRSFER